MEGSVAQFKAAIQAAGVNPPGVIEADGHLHRFPTNGRAGDDSGWYIFHGDGIPSGAFGDWRSGLSEKWCADIGRVLTPAEEAAHRAKVEEMRRAREADEAKLKVEAASKAAAIWKAAQPASGDHPYLARKRIKAHGLRMHQGALVLPVRDGNELHSLQFIAEDGDKRFLTGGRVRGCYHVIGKPDGLLCLCEGFATGASIHEATGQAVAITFTAGSLLPAAKALRAKFPEITIVLCADDDYRTDGNPGLAKATEAARAVDGRLAIPDFGVNRPDGATDFNDMHCRCGAESVKQCIDAACVPEPEPPNADETIARMAKLSSRVYENESIARLAKLKPLEYDKVREEEASKLGVRIGTLDKEVSRLRKAKAERIVAQKEEIPCPQLNGDTLSLADKAIADSGYGGDRKLPLLLYLCSTSRLLSFSAGNMLAHAQVVGAPSGGKNFALNTVLSLLPEDSYLKIDAGSPKALIYSSEDLRHRIVFFSEADSLPVSESSKSLADGDSRSTAASALRNLASDGYLSYDIVERDPETSQFVTRHIRKDGPTVLLTTTTKAIGGQMGTRLWELPLVESDSQISAALRSRMDWELLRQHADPSDLVLYQEYLQSKVPWDVIVPIARELGEGLLYRGMNPRILRDYQRILALIKAVTVLRHQEREQDAGGRWIATLDDYEYVRGVLGESYAATVNDGLTDDVRAVVKAVSDLREKGNTSVAYLDVAKILGWNNKRVQRKASIAIKHGWIVNRQKEYRRPADLDAGADVPDSRGLPFISPQNRCQHVHLLKNKDFSVDMSVDTVDTVLKSTVDNAVDRKKSMKSDSGHVDSVFGEIKGGDGNGDPRGGDTGDRQIYDPLDKPTGDDLSADEVFTLAIQLLVDIRDLFAERKTDRLCSQDLAEALGQMEDRPWFQFGRMGKPVTQNGVARLLKPFAIHPKQIRFDEGNKKGYEFESFSEVFSRFLEGIQTDTPIQTSIGAGFSDFQTETRDDDVSVANSRKANNDAGCIGVSVVKGGIRRNEEDPEPKVWEKPAWEICPYSQDERDDGEGSRMVRGIIE